MTDTDQAPPPSYFVQCLECDWARCYRGHGVVPTVPHALHFVETGHDKIRSGNRVPHRTQEFTPAEWSDAIMFSAGVQYGGIYVSRTIKAKVLEALPDADHLAPGRERDVHTLEQVEAFKRDQGPVMDPVHILHQDLTLCVFSSSIPAHWPKGHTWVSLKEVKGGLARPTGACSICWRRWEGLDD